MTLVSLLLTLNIYLRTVLRYIFRSLLELLDAVEKGNLAETLRMLNIDAESVNARYGDGSNDTLLHKAARKGYCRIANELLINHADVNAKNKKEETPLMVALQASPLTGGHRKVIKELLNHHAEVNSQDEHGTTPLMTACYRGHYVIVKELLNHDANVNIQSKHCFDCGFKTQTSVNRNGTALS